MYRSYSKFLEELQKAIRKRYGEGKPREIKNDLERLSEKFQIELSEAETARKSIENKFMNEWVDKRTELSDSGAFNLTANFAKVGGKLNTDVFRAIDRGLRNNMSMKQISDLVRRVGVLGEHHSRTAGRTAKMGKLRTEYLANHLKAGCKEFKYAGPTGASATQDEPRDFCRKHLGKIYTIEQILKLNNGQGLSVLIYMGGYNCRHRWEAVYNSDELRNANEDKSEIVDGEFKDGIFIEKAWAIKFENSNKQDRETMQREYDNGKYIKKHFPDTKVRFSLDLAAPKNPDPKTQQTGSIDCYINNIQTELKNNSKTKVDGLRETLRRRPSQADQIIIINEVESENFEKQLEKIKKWLYFHQEKTVFVVSKKNNIIKKVTYDKIESSEGFY